MNFDKAEVSRRQLGTALALFLDDQDAVSVHTLAAGSEIAEHLTRIADQKPFSTHALETIPDLDIGKLFRLQIPSAVVSIEPGLREAGGLHRSPRIYFQRTSTSTRLVSVISFRETIWLIAAPFETTTVQPC